MRRALPACVAAALIGSPPGASAARAHIAFRNCHGFSCSRSSYSREIGRIICSATVWNSLRFWVCGSIRNRSCRRSPSSMISHALDSELLRRVSSGLAAKSAQPSDRGESVERGKAARVAQPHLDRMLADIAVAAEHLDRVVGDLQRGCGGIVAGEIALLDALRARSRCAAASHTSRRAASISIAMSASMKAIACLVAIGTPKALRSLA